jgi:hypothetical protein
MRIWHKLVKLEYRKGAFRGPFFFIENLREENKPFPYFCHNHATNLTGRIDDFLQRQRNSSGYLKHRHALDF